MRNFVSGLLIGALLVGGGSYLYFPKLKQAAYDEGQALGKAEGIKVGTATGIEEGMAQGLAKAELDKKLMQDSLNKQIEEAKASRKIVRIPVERKPTIQNWRVLGGQIAEPIIATEPTKTP
jgi:hypothetical protein